jgi:hypothetical protein
MLGSSTSDLLSVMVSTVRRFAVMSLLAIGLTTTYAWAGSTKHGSGEVIGLFGSARPGVASTVRSRYQVADSDKAAQTSSDSPQGQSSGVSSESSAPSQSTFGPVTISVRKPVPPLIGVSAMTCSTAGPIGGGGTTVGGPTAADCIVQAVPARNRGRRARQKQRAAPPRPQVDPIAVAWAALDKAVALAPDPKLSFAPSRLGMTGLDSFVWLDPAPRPIEATAEVPGLMVYAQAQPASFTWNFGDGTSESSDSPGVPWSKGGSLSHVYQSRGVYLASVTIRWTASWRTSDSGWQALGAFTTSANTRYPVRQMVAVLVPASR